MSRLAALLCCASFSSALGSTQLSGRITRAEDGSEAFKTAIGRSGRTGYILRLKLATDAGELAVVNVVETVTRVIENGAGASMQALRAGRRVRASLPDGCQVASERCVAIEITVVAGGMRTLEARRVDDDALEAPGMRPSGQSHEGSRDAAERLDNAFPCPEGLVPLMSGGRRAMDESGKPACQAKRSFVKGELTNLGSDKLVVADSRFGLRMGYARLDGMNYFALQPEVDLHFGSGVALGLGVPLNVLAYPQGFYDTGKIKLRKHDYDKASEYARILRFFTVGRKEDQFYLNVSQLVAASIGHGAIVRRYSGNTDQNITRVGAQLDAYGKYGGFEAFVGDVVQPQHFVAGLAFVKPLGFLSGDLGNTLGQTSLGLSTAADFSAPYTLSRVANKYPEVADDGEPIALETRRAQVVGADLETKVVKTEGADIKIFGDYSHLLGVSAPSGAGAQGGGGFTLGTLGRFNAGDVKLHAFRVVLEGRYFDGNYLPGYFDTFYEVQKYQFITGKADTGYEPKLRTILGRDPAHKRAGYYVEAAYQYNGGLALSAAFEDSFHVSGPDDICTGCPPDQKRVGARNLTLHIEYPAYSWLQFFGSYYRRSFEGPLINSGSVLSDDNTLIYAALRLHLLPILFLNARIFRSWHADPVLGEMRNVYGGEFDLELGYEFDRSQHARR
jgi:hypothetical protein